MDKNAYLEVNASQKPAVEILGSMGYTYISPEDCDKQRGSRYHVLLKDVLRGQLRRLNRYTYAGVENEFSAANIERAMEDLDEPLTDGLVRTSEKIYDALLLGKSVVSEPAQVKERIGVSPQETAVAPNLTVRENLEMMCGVYGLQKADAAARIGELTETFHLEEVLSRRAGKLSGGWQRRLSIAMALVGNPAVLFLDEPTLGLDVLARSDLWDTIKTLKGKATIVLTTHYMEEAEALSDRVGIMGSGKLLALGTVEALKAETGAARLEDAFVRIVKEASK